MWKTRVCKKLINYVDSKQSNLSSAFVFKNLKAFLTNVLTLDSSFMLSGRLLNNLEAES